MYACMCVGVSVCMQTWVCVRVCGVGGGGGSACVCVHACVHACMHACRCMVHACMRILDGAIEQKGERDKNNFQKMEKISFCLLIRVKIVIYVYCVAFSLLVYCMSEWERLGDVIKSLPTI